MTSVDGHYVSWRRPEWFRYLGQRRSGLPPAGHALLCVLHRWWLIVAQAVRKETPQPLVLPMYPDERKQACWGTAPRCHAGTRARFHRCTVSSGVRLSRGSARSRSPKWVRLLFSGSICGLRTRVPGCGGRAGVLSCGLGRLPKRLLSGLLRAFLTKRKFLRMGGYVSTGSVGSVAGGNREHREMVLLSFFYSRRCLSFSFLPGCMIRSGKNRGDGRKTAEWRPPPVRRHGTGRPIRR